MRVWIKLYFIFYMVQPLVIGASETKTYFLEHENDKVAITFYKFKETFINDICFKKIKRCQAFKAYQTQSKNRFDSKKYKNLSSPAAAFCKFSYGVPLILRDQKLNQASFCAFDDKTIIDSWNLYNSYLKTHNQNKKK